MKGDSLSFNGTAETKRICGFIRKILRSAEAEGLVVGLSGGVDSSVVGALCIRAIGKDKVLGVLMPSDHTPAQDMADARALAKGWGIESREVRISPMVEEIVAAAGGGKSKIPIANVQARVRMTILYFLANSRNRLVAGTGDKSEELLGYFCYDQKTRVVTTEGPKAYNELLPGDRVFSYNPSSGAVVESQVEDVHIFDYDGYLVRFRGSSSDLMVTPNHRMLIRTTGDSSTGRVVFRSASECLGLKRVVVPVPVYWPGETTQSQYIRLAFGQKQVKRVIAIDIDDILYVIGLFVGDGSAVKSKVVVPVVSNLSREQYAAFPRNPQGQFVRVPESESSPIMKTYESFETVFALPVPDKNLARATLIKILEKYGIGYSLTQNFVRISGKGIYDFFFQFGVGAHNKRIPPWVLAYPSSHLVRLLRGLKDSDESHAEDTHMYYTSSPRLKDEFCELAVKLGRYPTVRERPPHVSQYLGKVIRTGVSYDISYGKGGHYSRTLITANARRVRYRGKVWCPSVPPYENILVERNGHYIFSGNTKWGDGGADFFPIAHLYKTQVLALGEHLGLPRRIIAKPPSPQLWPGHTAEEELPAAYERLDVLLACLFDQKLSPAAAAARAKVPRRVVDEVIAMHKRSAHKRLLPPSLV